jgi:hypothetical protein
MSVASATDFSEGPELFDQEKYWSQVSTAVEPDPKTIDEEFRKPLKDRISGPINITGKYAYYRLDDVDVRIPADAFRQYEVDQWTQAKKEAEGKQWRWSLIAIGSAAFAAIGGGLAWAGFLGTEVAQSPLALAIVVAGVVVVVVSAVFITAAGTAITKAAEQINKWGGAPLMKIGQARNSAHEQGFPYIYTNSLKLGREPSYTALFHPKQVEHEYKKYFKSFCKTMLAESCSSCKVTWMKDFLTSNPLSSRMMKYGLGEVPQRMTQVVADYDRLGAFLADIQKSYSDLKARETDMAKERIEIYNHERTTKLQPLVDARNDAIAVAKANRDRVFEQHPLETSSQNREARRNFEGLKKASDEDYAARAAPINKKYDSMIQASEKDRDARLQKLDDQNFHQLTNNYNAARELLIRADQAWKGQTYQPVSFQQYFPWQSAPAQPFYYPFQPQPAVYRPEQKAQRHRPDYQQQPPVPPMYQQPTTPIYPQMNTGYVVQQPVYPQPSAPPYQHAGYLPRDPMNPHYEVPQAG